MFIFHSECDNRVKIDPAHGPASWIAFQLVSKASTALVTLRPVRHFDSNPFFRRQEHLYVLILSNLITIFLVIHIYRGHPPKITLMLILSTFLDTVWSSCQTQSHFYMQFLFLSTRYIVDSLSDCKSFCKRTLKVKSRADLCKVSLAEAV
jgi:hypothetical protein